MPRIDVPEVARERMQGEFGDRAGHLDAGRPAADHDDRHQPVALGLVRGAVGAFERGQQFGADEARIFEAARALGVRRPIGMTEV